MKKFFNRFNLEIKSTNVKRYLNTTIYAQLEQDLILIIASVLAPEIQPRFIILLMTERSKMILLFYAIWEPNIMGIVQISL